MEDRQIVMLFHQRSETAIGELDKKYGKLCRTLAYGILGSREDAEECVNDAYLGAWNAIPPARPDPLRPYLCRIVRNLSLKARDRREAAKRSSPYDVALQELEECLPAAGTVEGELAAKELTAMLRDFLDALKREDRILFLRRYWFSDSYAQIARRMGLTEKNVSVRLSRLRRKLKDYLTEREVFL